MKIESGSDARIFKPVELKFTCESEAELQFFKDMFNPDLDPDEISFEPIPLEYIYSEIKHL